MLGRAEGREWIAEVRREEEREWVAEECRGKGMADRGEGEWVVERKGVN